MKLKHYFIFCLLVFIGLGCKNASALSKKYTDQTMSQEQNDGWKKYVNEKYGYEILYPAKGHTEEIEQSGQDGRVHFLQIEESATDERGGDDTYAYLSIFEGKKRNEEIRKLKLQIANYSTKTKVVIKRLNGNPVYIYSNLDRQQTFIFLDKNEKSYYLEINSPRDKDFNDAVLQAFIQKMIKSFKVY